MQIYERKLSLARHESDPLKMAELLGVSASSIGRYERNIIRPTAECFLIYVDCFDVSLDYIFGRCDEPQGKLYEHCPHVELSNPELKPFGDMCFDPASPMSGRLKEGLTKMLEDTKNDTSLCKRTCVCLGLDK